MEVRINSQIHIRNPSQNIISWANRNLILPNPDYTTKVRLGLYTGKTPQTLTLYEKHGDELILPYGTLRSIVCWLDGDTDTHEMDFPPIRRVDYRGEVVPLYDYQSKAVEALFDSHFGILQSPAGSGKTQMGIALVKEYGRTALWLTHTQDLLNQSMERARQYIDPSLIGTITGGKVNIGKGITFATVQTMCRLDLDQYKDYWDVVIVDECHHVAGSPTRVGQFYKVLSHLRARHKYGLSATVHRSDGLIAATYAMLGEIVHTVPDSAVAEKIMKVQIKPVGTGVPITDDCLNPDGTLSFTRLITYLSDEVGRNLLIVEDIFAEQEHPALILSDRLNHLLTLMEMLPPSLREKAVMVTGKTAKDEREKALDEMRKGNKKYLFATYALAKEGLDIPCLERLFMATPVKDEAVVIQSIGRIARACEGKGQPVAYDYVDNIRFCERAYKERTKHYRKIGATLI